MANDSSRSAIGLGIVQIVIGLWFLVLGGLLLFIFLVAPNIYRKKEWQICVAVTSIFVLFISSGSLAIAAATKKTNALVKATFGFSVLSSVTALSILTLSITGEIMVFLRIFGSRSIAVGMLDSLSLDPDWFFLDYEPLESYYRCHWTQFRSRSHWIHYRWIRIFFRWIWVIVSGSIGVFPQVWDFFLNKKRFFYLGASLWIY